MAAESDLIQKARAANDRIAPIAIQMAVKQALVSLGINNVDPRVGDHLKASLTAKDYENIKGVLTLLSGLGFPGLEEVTTLSGQKAARVKLDNTWELRFFTRICG